MRFDHHTNPYDFIEFLFDFKRQNRSYFIYRWNMSFKNVVQPVRFKVFPISHRQSIIESKMLVHKSGIVLMFIVFIDCGLCRKDQSVSIEYNVPLAAFPSHWILHENRIDPTDEYFSPGDFFSPDDFFPIEINVPDTVISAWDSLNTAWSTASDYFSMGQGEMPENSGKFSPITN